MSERIKQLAEQAFMVCLKGADEKHLEQLERFAELVRQDEREQADKQTHTDHPIRHWDRTCPACVAEAEKQEPVAWVYINEDGECEQIEYGVSTVTAPYITLLYTAPPKREQEIFIGTDLTADGMHLVIRRGNEIIHSQFYEAPKREWVGLTDEEMSDTYNRHYNDYASDNVGIIDFIVIARAIESKLRERNT
jgi:hypothetical protein